MDCAHVRSLHSWQVLMDMQGRTSVRQTACEHDEARSAGMQQASSEQNPHLSCRTDNTECCCHYRCLSEVGEKLMSLHIGLMSVWDSCHEGDSRSIVL